MIPIASPSRGPVWVACVVLAGCSTAGGADAGFDGPVYDAPRGRDVSPLTPDAGFDSGRDSGQDARSTLSCVRRAPVSLSAGDTCLSRGLSGPCASLCDAGAFYSCLPTEIPAGVGACVAVDAGEVTAAATVSLCCGMTACVRYSPADGTCPNAAWSCPAGGAGPAGASSTGTGPTADTVIWCL